MTAKETVSQGLRARKDVRAAEAKVEKIREDLVAANDARFREQVNHQRAERIWQSDKEILLGLITRQQAIIRQLRESQAKAHKREQNSRRLRTLIGAMEAVALFGLLILAREHGWIVAWLADSLSALSLTLLFFAFVKLARNI